MLPRSLCAFLLLTSTTSYVTLWCEQISTPHTQAIKSEQEPLRKIDEPDFDDIEQELYQEFDEIIDFMDPEELTEQALLVEQHNFEQPWYIVAAGKISAPLFSLYNSFQKWWYQRQQKKACACHHVKKKRYNGHMITF